MKARIVLAALLLVGCAGAQTTLTGTNCITEGNKISCPTSTVAFANPDDEVAVGGRVYKVRDLAAMYSVLENYPNQLLVASKPEPMDVPAVLENCAQAMHEYEVTYGDGPDMPWHVERTPFREYKEGSDSCMYISTWKDTAGRRGSTTRVVIRNYGCADKRRVLLTGEDGAHHCILFPEAQP